MHLLGGIYPQESAFWAKSKQEIKAQHVTLNSEKSCFETIITEPWAGVLATPVSLPSFETQPVKDKGSFYTQLLQAFQGKEVQEELELWDFILFI